MRFKAQYLFMFMLQWVRLEMLDSLHKAHVDHVALLVHVALRDICSQDIMFFVTEGHGHSSPLAAVVLCLVFSCCMRRLWGIRKCRLLSAGPALQLPVIRSAVTSVGRSLFANKTYTATEVAYKLVKGRPISRNPSQQCLKQE